jgi:hypothetical protein
MHDGLHAVSRATRAAEDKSCRVVACLLLTVAWLARSRGASVGDLIRVAARAAAELDALVFEVLVEAVVRHAERIPAVAAADRGTTLANSGALAARARFIQ